MTNSLIAARDRFATDHPERRMTVNGREWGTIRAGDTGPALVLIPGTLGRADIFWHQIKALEGEARILALTYPATGGIAEWAADVAAMITSEGLDTAVVLGSSLGGYLAQYFAGHYPRQVRGIVAANTLASAAGIDRMPPYSLDLDAVPIGELRSGFATGLKGWLDPANPYADLAALLLAEVEGRIPEAELRARLKALKHAPALPAQVLPNKARFTVESDDDHLISPQMRQALRAELAPDRAFRFGAASHFPYVTRPDEYTAMLREVLGLEPVATVWPAGAEAKL